MIETSGKFENCKVFVRPFHGATMRCLEDHVKSVLRKNPDEIIFHIRTNDLPSGEGNKNIAEVIINLAMSVKTQSCRVLIFWYYCEKKIKIKIKSKKQMTN